MRKILFALIFALGPTMAWAVAAPAGLVGGPVTSNTATLDWNEDTVPNQWNIYLGGVLRYQPFRSDTSVPTAGRRRYLLTNLPNQANIVVTMRALAPGQPISAESASLTITSSTVPISYVMNPPGQAITVTGSFTPASGGAATAVSATVTSDTSSSSATRNSALASISTSVASLDGKTTVVDTGAVSVSSSALPAGAATAAAQATGNASLASLDGKTTVVNTGAVSVSSSALPAGAATEATLSSLNGKVTVVDTGAVSVSSSALPAGAATAANQATELTALASLSTSAASLDGKTTVVNTGAVSVSSSALPAGAATEATLASIDGKTTVVNTGAVSVSSSALPAGAATEATLASLDGKTTVVNTGAVSVSSSALPAGAATAAKQLSGVASTGNSTVSTLGGGGVFTGTFEDVTQWSVFVVSIFVDQASATNGLQFQWSGNGSDVDRTESSSVPIGGRAFNLAQRGKFFRIVYTNGATPQTAFRLNTSYHPDGPGFITKPLSNTTTDDNFVQSVEAVQTGRLTNGNFAKIGAVYDSASGTSMTAVYASVSGTGATAAQFQGNAASGAATVGNPLGMGGRAATASPTAVDDGDRVETMMSKFGQPVTMPQALPDDVTKTSTTITGTSETTILTAGGAGVFWDIDLIFVSNPDANTDIEVSFRDSTGGIVVWNGGAARGMGGYVTPFPVPLPQLTANSDWTAQLDLGASPGVKINVVAHKRR